MVVPEFHDFAAAELRLQQQRYRTRAEQFRAAAAETHADWRLGIVGVRHDHWREQAVFRESIAEIVRMRLQIMYMPLFQGLERIQARIKILETVYSREDHYAPKPRQS